MPPVKMLEELSNMYNMTILHNRMMAYVENCIYGGKWDEYKTRVSCKIKFNKRFYALAEFLFLQEYSMQRKNLCMLYFDFKEEVNVARKYRFLSYEDRLKMESMLKNNMSVAAIAGELGMTRAAIYAELRKVGKAKDQKSYSADEAQKQLRRQCD